MIRLCAVSGALLALVCGLSARATAEEAFGSGATNAGGDLRTGWYPNEPSITPHLVSEGAFGRLWSASVEGQVYAQPLDYSGTLLVATEDDKLYGLDAASGTQEWSETLGTPWDPEELGSNCKDLAPSIGVTSTPVIDPETGTAYLTYKTAPQGAEPASWYMDAVEVATGRKRPGFPVHLQGSAEDAPSDSFDAEDQLQRPGLLLMNGVVYAAFGSDCDLGSWNGWVFGVASGDAASVDAAGTITARWVAEQTGEGAGIWQSGSGLVSDEPGSMLFSTGNGGVPEASTPGSTPPPNLGESVVRLKVEQNGSLAATDFFTPPEAALLSSEDMDFASGGVVALPDEYFGQGTSTPHLAVVAGKDAYVYLLNRDNLGGFKYEGEGEVVQRLPESFSVPNAFPYGGVWSRPGVWPGEGGWVYIPTDSVGPPEHAEFTAGRLLAFQYSSAGGKAHLVPEASTGEGAEEFGFGTSAPVITSNGTTPDSALVWVEWAPAKSGGSGAGAQLRAYAPVPEGGQQQLLWSESIGTSSKFATPGIGEGRLFVGARDGHVLAFGPALSGAPVAFAPTTVGEVSHHTATLTANEPLTLTQLESSSTHFPLGAPSIKLPAALASGQAIEVPIGFSPPATGPQAATLTATLSTGKAVTFALSGSGREAAPPETTPIAPIATGPILTPVGPAPSRQASSPPPPDAKLTLLKLTADRHGIVTATISCPVGQSRCVGSVTLRSLFRHPANKHKAAWLPIAAGRFDLAGGHIVAVELRLLSRGRAQLARDHKLSVRAITLARNSAGLAHTARQVATIART